MYFKNNVLKVKLASLVLFSFCFVNNSDANVVGVDTQNFNPITDGLDYVTVHSSKTLEPGILNFGFFLNYAVNSLPNYENVSNQSRSKIVDTLLSSDLNFGYGLSSFWDIGFSLPQVHQQTVDSEVFRGEYDSSGITEYRFNSKMRLYGSPYSGGIATVLSMNLNQIQDNPFTGTNPGPTFNIEAVVDHTWGLLTGSLNLGYRIRNPGEPIEGVPVNPFGNQYLVSTGISYLVTSLDLKLIGEIFGSFPAESDSFASDRDLSSTELLIGAKMDIRNDIAFHFGAGTEINHGTGSPDWRVYTGLNWTLGPNEKTSQSSFVRIDPDTLVEVLDEDPFANKLNLKREAFIAKDILFGFNSDKLNDEFVVILERLVKYLSQSVGVKKVVVIGHTDSIGPANYNLELSKRRAKNVAMLLVKLGLNKEIVSYLGKGESQPIASNANYQQRAKNRRVEFQVYR